ncbi:hypothetical protein GQ53DRAFT_136152 [Thozetella sp. PMI_491]|nr:hypothetical protein GQ53DRAFT_136152 [Thozetella sp. PMI_491]
MIQACATKIFPALALVRAFCQQLLGEINFVSKHLHLYTMTLKADELRYHGPRPCLDWTEWQPRILFLTKSPQSTLRGFREIALHQGCRQLYRSGHSSLPARRPRNRPSSSSR